MISRKANETIKKNAKRYFGDSADAVFVQCDFDDGLIVGRLILPMVRSYSAKSINDFGASIDMVFESVGVAFDQIIFDFISA